MREETVTSGTEVVSTPDCPMDELSVEALLVSSFPEDWIPSSFSVNDLVGAWASETVSNRIDKKLRKTDDTRKAVSGNFIFIRALMFWQY